MRIRTLISGSLALAAMLFAQSCGDKNEPEGLPEINLSKNVIEFQQEQCGMDNAGLCAGDRGDETEGRERSDNRRCGSF